MKKWKIPKIIITPLDDDIVIDKAKLDKLLEEIMEELNNVEIGKN